MKRSFFFGIMAMMIWACSPVKEAVDTSASLTKNSDDSTEYEIHILDLRFDQWYLMNFNPSRDQSNEYYRTKNMRAVSNWNEYFRTNRYGNIIDTSIEYWPNIDYGIEVNRKLYWYFKYIRAEYGIRLFW